jgi:hypothetical protein
MKTTLTTLQLIIVPDWMIEFHVHINALNYVIRSMSVQNLDNTLDKPIYYASRLMTRTKKNYSIIEKETLTMIYVIKKLCHFLLGNNFTLFVDHQALIYLINKPTITR